MKIKLSLNVMHWQYRSFAKRTYRKIWTKMKTEMKTVEWNLVKTIIKTTLKRDTRSMFKNVSRQLIYVGIKFLPAESKKVMFFFQNNKHHYNTPILCKNCRNTFTTVKVFLKLNWYIRKMSLVLWIFLKRKYLTEKNSFKIFLRFLDFSLILNVDVKKIQKIKAEIRKIYVIKTQSRYYSTFFLTENTFFNLYVVVVLELNCREGFVKEMQELESKLYSFVL